MPDVGCLNLTVGNGRSIVLTDNLGNFVAKISINKKFKGNNVPLVIEAPKGLKIARSKTRKEALCP
jgi:sRNA-binding carbon storage regulator CsrA